MFSVAPQQKTNKQKYKYNVINYTNQRNNNNNNNNDNNNNNNNDIYIAPYTKVLRRFTDNRRKENKRKLIKYKSIKLIYCIWHWCQWTYLICSVMKSEQN